MQPEALATKSTASYCLVVIPYLVYVVLFMQTLQSRICVLSKDLGVNR